MKNIMLVVALFVSLTGAAHAQKSLKTVFDTTPSGYKDRLCGLDSRDAINREIHQRNVPGAVGPGIYTDMYSVFRSHLRAQGVIQPDFGTYSFKDDRNQYPKEAYFTNDGTVAASDIETGDVIVLTTVRNILDSQAHENVSAAKSFTAKSAFASAILKEYTGYLGLGLSALALALQVEQSELEKTGEYLVVNVVTVNQVYRDEPNGVFANVSVVRFDPYDVLNNINPEVRDAAYIAGIADRSISHADGKTFYDFTRDVVLDDGLEGFIASGFDSADRTSSVHLRFPEVSQARYVKEESGLCDACGGVETCSVEWQQCMAEHQLLDGLNNGKFHTANAPLHEYVFGSACSDDRCLIADDINTCADRRACLQKYDREWESSLQYLQDHQLCSDLSKECHSYDWSADLREKKGTTYFQDEHYTGDESTLLISTTVAQSKRNIQAVAPMVCAQIIRDAINADYRNGSINQDYNTGGSIEVCGKRREIEGCFAGVVTGLSDLEIDGGISFESQNSTNPTGGSSADAQRYTRLGDSLVRQSSPIYDPGVRPTGGKLDLGAVGRGLGNAWRGVVKAAKAVGNALKGFGEWVGGLFGGGGSGCPNQITCTDGNDDDESEGET